MECSMSSCGSTKRAENGRGGLFSPVVSSSSYHVDSALFRSLLVLDSTRGELVEAPAKLERKVVAQQRTTEALKSHSEAEKRRRARINMHFNTLRSLIPGANKIDKSSLLGEVIDHLKDLKRKATEANEQYNIIPKDIDEVIVEQHNDHQYSQGRPNKYSMRVSLSCDYRPGILSDLRQTLNAMHLMMTSAEISTMGHRMKNIFVITSSEEEVNLFEDEREILYQLRARSICQAIRSVIEKNVSSSGEFFKTIKRRRVSG